MERGGHAFRQIFNDAAVDRNSPGKELLCRSADILQDLSSVGFVDQSRIDREVDLDPAGAGGHRFGKQSLLDRDDILQKLMPAGIVGTSKRNELLQIEVRRRRERDLER